MSRVKETKLTWLKTLLRVMKIKHNQANFKALDDIVIYIVHFQWVNIPQCFVVTLIIKREGWELPVKSCYLKIRPGVSLSVIQKMWLEHKVVKTHKNIYVCVSSTFISIKYVDMHICLPNFWLNRFPFFFSPDQWCFTLSFF